MCRNIMEHIVKENTLKECKAGLRTLSNIYDGAFCGNSQHVLAIIYFHKKLHHRFVTHIQFE